MKWNTSRLKFALAEYARFIEIAGIDFSLMEIRLLILFLNANTEWITREELTKSLWLLKTVHPKTLDVHLFNLRKKLGRTQFRILFEPKHRGWKIVSSDIEEKEEQNDKNWRAELEGRRRVL